MSNGLFTFVMFPFYSDPYQVLCAYTFLASSGSGQMTCDT